MQLRDCFNWSKKKKQTKARRGLMTLAVECEVKSELVKQ